MKERIGYYDIARGLGIIFVVIGHIETVYMPFRSYIVYFHMALFFIISGMLIMETGEEQKKWTAVSGKKISRIMVPYFLFSVISVLIEGVRLLAAGVFYWPHLRSLLVSTLTLQGNSVMWFLPALFISELLFLGIRKLAVVLSGTRKVAADILTVVTVVLLVGCLVWSNIFEQAFYAGHAGIERYERLHDVLSMLIRGGICTFFVSTGYFVRKYIVPLKVPAYIGCTAAVLFLLICAGMNHINPGVDLRALDWGETDIWVKDYYVTECVKAVMYMMGAVSGALGIVFLCRSSEKFTYHLNLKVLAFLGSNSLVIMATHLDFHILHVSTEIAGYLNQYIDNTVFYHICLLIFVFAAEAVLILLINRYAPVLAGRYRKNKNFS